MNGNSYQTPVDDYEQAARATASTVRDAHPGQETVDQIEFGSGWYHEVAIAEAEKPVPQKH